MGVRPPPSDGDEPDLVEFGIAALDAELSEADLDFPATAAEVRAALGGTEVEYDPAGHTVTLGEVLDRVETGRFETEQELLEALHPVFEDLRANRSPGIIGWLRSLLP